LAGSTAEELPVNLVLYVLSTIPLFACAMAIYLAVTTSSPNFMQLISLAVQAFIAFAVFYTGGAVVEAINTSKNK
jgi:hypothetical protein